MGEHVRPALFDALERLWHPLLDAPLSHDTPMLEDEITAMRVERCAHVDDAMKPEHSSTKMRRCFKPIAVGRGMRWQAAAGGLVESV
jgi:hypothetical protein